MGGNWGRWSGSSPLVPVADVSGPEMYQGKIVTMFNDMCFMAPATLIDPAISWEAVDDRTARAHFANAGQAIRAELSFNQAGELTTYLVRRSVPDLARWKDHQEGEVVHATRWLPLVRTGPPRFRWRGAMARGEW